MEAERPVTISPDDRVPGTEPPEADSLRVAPELPAAEPDDAELPAARRPDAPASNEVASAESTPGSAEKTGHAVVPVPDTFRQERQRTPFWKRIRLRGRLGSATGDDRTLARLDDIASRIESAQHEIDGRIAELDRRFSEVWEVEEQLSRLMELRDMLEDLQQRQGRIDGRLSSLSRRLTGLTVLAGVAAVAGLLAVAAALL